MKNFRLLITILFPFTMLVVLYVYHTSTIQASMTYVLPNMFLYNVLIGLILAISLYLISTIKLETSHKQLIYLGNTLIWVLFVIIVWTQLKIDSTFLVAMVNKYYLLLAIAFTNVIKSATSFYELTRK